MIRFTVLFSLLAGIASAQSAATDWPMFGHDPGATRYSPLKQIDAGNVTRLERAWTFHTGRPGTESIPVVIDGVLYVTGANGVFAVDPVTGHEIWRHEATKVALRGLAYWPGGKNMHPRVFVGIAGRLVSLDATSGQPATGFGDEGSIDLKQGVLGDLKDAVMALQSPPVIYKDLVITGSVPNEGSPSKGAYGDIRAWDARTGKLVWQFHTVPRPGEPGNETWPGGSWKNRSGTNNWGFLSIDIERGLLFVPLGSPTSDFYGADRPGKGLYGNSLVALDAATGKLRWYQQLVHHDLWDYDPAAAPILITVHRHGRAIPAVAQITKMGLAFIFDRRTGEPVFGMEERPVPQSRVPGEHTWPTQPFPVWPPPLARNTFSPGDLYNLTPEHAAFCKDLFEKNQMYTEGPYTPLPTERNALLFPSTLGGGNWSGFSSDPALGYIFTNVNNIGQWGHMEWRKDPKSGEFTWVRTSPFGAYARFWDPATRIPCTKPPFGELVAVNVNTGRIAWRSPLGSIPALDQRGIHDTGSMSLGGSIATAGGVVFIAATNDHQFRAFESKSGRLLWQTSIDANGHSIPITYLGRDGRQYVAIMAAGGGAYFGGAPSDALVAFALGGGSGEITERTQSSAEPAANTGDKAMASPEFFEKTCTRCHDLDTVSSSRRSRDEWAAVVQSMIDRGAELTDAQAVAIVNYLARNYGFEGK